MSARKFFSAAALGLLFCVSAATASSAVTASYATSTSPQVASGYGSTARTYGTWVASKKSATSVSSSLSAAYFRFINADNHKAFVELNTIVQRPASNDFVNLAKTSSRETKVSGSWSAFGTPPSVSLPINTSGTLNVSAGVKTCVDVPFRTDPCSSVTVRSGRL